MDVGKLKSLYEALGPLLEELQTKKNDAKEDVVNAMQQARDAQEYADTAHSYADSCDDRLIEMQQTIDELSARLEDLDKIIAQAAAEAGSGDPEDSLSYQIAKHKKQVLHHLRQGHSVKAIANHMGITETLVEMIKRADERERTTAA